MRSGRKSRLSGQALPAAVRRVQEADAHPPHQRPICLGYAAWATSCVLVKYNAVQGSCEACGVSDLDHLFLKLRQKSLRR